MIQYIHFDLLNSTNDWIKNHFQSLSLDHFTCVTARTQSAGKGQFKKKWYSPPGNLYASLFFTLPTTFPYLANLGQLMACSCLEVLKEYGIRADFKWPNDLLVKRKKLAGILTEIIHLENLYGIILGLGMNINMSLDDLKHIDQPATSFSQIYGQQEDPMVILHKIASSFIKNLEDLKHHSLKKFIHIMNECLAYKKEFISIQKQGKLYRGICVGLSDQGHLELQLDSGEILIFISGEIDQPPIQRS